MAALSFERIFEPIRALLVSHFDEIVRCQARRPLKMAAIAVHSGCNSTFEDEIPGMELDYFEFGTRDLSDDEDDGSDNEIWKW